MPSTPIAPHSPAWIAQTWISFVLSAGTTAIGIMYLPEGPWIRAFLGMGLIFTIGSTLSLAKTTRDLHEAHRPTSRIDEPGSAYR